MASYSLEDQPNSKTALLSPSTSTTPRPSTTTSKFLYLLLTASLALLATFVFAGFLLSSTSPFSPNNHSHATQNTRSSAEFARPLTKLDHPVVILISLDGFRFGYQYKTHLPNIRRLIDHGTEADRGLISSYPTQTFPNHYSIATGLYPESHGIVANSFFDPSLNDNFSRGRGSSESKWWWGEPLWETVSKKGLQAATYFWPGSQVHKDDWTWTCSEPFCQQPYDPDVPFEERVKKILSYFDDSENVPSFMALYISEPDSQGHRWGLDPPNSTYIDAIKEVDGVIGQLIQGLEKRGVFEEVNIILLSDHGFVSTPVNKTINLLDLAPWITISSSWVDPYRAVLGIRPNISVPVVLAKMKEGLNSGKIKNGKKLKLYLKENLPKRLHYAATDRISPIIGLVDEGYSVWWNVSTRRQLGANGDHGYDNKYSSMRGIFIGHGPRFPRGKKVNSFENVQVYNLVTSILNITGAPNNGSAAFPHTVLLPDPNH